MQIFNKILILLSISLISNLQSQNAKQYTYSALTDILDSYQENDERAMIFVNIYIIKAKKERNLSKLIAGYEEAVFYSSSVDNKIRYADSTVFISLKNKDPDLISMSYLKRGIVYYYNKKNYRRALDEYILAFKNAENTKDLYLYNKILYNLGLVDLYLGYYQEAASHFKETAIYYEKHISASEHPYIVSNNNHGYLNSIYRLIDCYRNLKLYKKEDSLINVGIHRVVNNDEFALEYAYFQKARGVLYLRNNNNYLAEKYLKTAESILTLKQDFATLSAVYYYLEKFNIKIGNDRESLRYSKKVDSLLNKYNFVTPEIIKNYEFLIKKAQKQGDDRAQLYYTMQLLKADSIIKKDFTFLSNKMYREYAVDKLTVSRDKLIRKQKCESKLLTIFIIVILSISYIFLYRFRKKEKNLTLRYNELLDKINNPELENEKKSLEISHAKSIYANEVIDEVLKNLKIFEEKKLFLDKDLKLPDVAHIVKTNRSILSFVLNEHLNITFYQYLKKLRIQYISKMLLADPKFLKYSMDTLAEECGMKNRIVFSNHFLEINGMRPIDFIRKRQEELAKK